MALQIQPSAKTPAVPAEIWMHVAEFIPHANLCSMFSINRAFFQLSMDAKYRELSFGTDSDAEALWKLQRVRDPSIAHRVRHLYIYLQYGDEFFRQFNEEGHLNPGWPSISLLDGIQIMTETVTFLTNVTEFLVKWLDSPSREHLVPFLVAAWKSFGCNLRKLSFQVSLKNLVTLLSTVDGLVSLNDLEVKVRGHEFVDTHGEALRAALALFVNKVGPTLRSLSYSSWLNNMDVSPFFDRLENFPKLERLRLFVNNRGSIFIEPVGPTRFLRNHAITLRHLDWTWRNALSREQNSLDLLSENNLEEVFSNLCTLRIRIPRCTGGFAMTVQRIRCSAKSLTSLVLLGYDATYEEVNTVISIFAPHSVGKLKELSLRVQFLSPELILLLARTLPLLEKLAVHIVHVTGDEAGKGTLEAIEEQNYIYREQEALLNAALFADAMRKCDLRGWALRDIDIGETTWERNLSKKLMWVLAECVPSVQTFCGADKASESFALDPHDRLCS